MELSISLSCNLYIALVHGTCFFQMVSFDYLNFIHLKLKLVSQRLFMHLCVTILNRFSTTIYSTHIIRHMTQKFLKIHQCNGLLWKNKAFQFSGMLVPMSLIQYSNKWFRTGFFCLTILHYREEMNRMHNLKFVINSHDFDFFYICLQTN